MKKFLPIPKGFNFDSKRIELENGLSMHYVELIPEKVLLPEKLDLMVCIHGWPDCWFGFRKVMTFMQEDKNFMFRVVVPDQRGYGQTILPAKVKSKSETYSMEEVVNDNLLLLKQLGYEKAVFFGHDWGGTTVWSLAMHFPKRVKAVISVCTPLFPVPRKNPWAKFEKMLQDPAYDGKGNRFDYQVYFQRTEAVKELNDNVDIALKLLHQSSMAGGEDDLGFLQTQPSKNGFFKLYSRYQIEKLRAQRSSLHTGAELRYYVESYKNQGFYGPLSWYRNVEKNWQWNQEIRGKKVSSEIPCLMITAENDVTLPPSMVETLGMRESITNLTVRNVKDAGHWVLQEKPKEIYKHIKEFLAVEGKKNSKL
eukprot:augustus_masked-scaffold_14-processed-gene-2.7-mRNA-1 protein AED:1.00 eAED:1.00 QI:0/-1/0/0/-1/1/1/0/365